jgi:hypothetical protein
MVNVHAYAKRSIPDDLWLKPNGGGISGYPELKLGSSQLRKPAKAGS